MIYLSGCIRPELLALKRLDLGVIITPQMGNRPDLAATSWAADNGCFARPNTFDLGFYLTFLKVRAAFIGTCLFATAPDVVGDAAATWARSEPVLPVIRSLGFKAALVAQDGIDPKSLDWAAFDVLFLGGSTAFKLSHQARDLTQHAKDRGKPVHMGRVNSKLRLETAVLWGCDSADGTFLAFGPALNIPRLLKWLDSMKEAPTFNFGVSA